MSDASAQRAVPTWHDFGSDCAADAVGMDQRALERLRPVLEGWVMGGRMPHATALVARHGKVAWWGGCGEQNPGKEISADTIYRMYSMTKPIVSAAIMTLLEEGKLHLTMPVHLLLGKSWRRENMSVFAGGSKDSPVLEPCQTNITILHLLTHTSGLTYGFDGAEAFSPVAAMYQDKFNKLPQGIATVDHAKSLIAETGMLRLSSSMGGLVEDVAALPLCFQPGTQWHYGMNLDVLGRIVEVVSGESLGDFLQRRIFAPLSMVDTSFVVPHEKEDRFSNCWYTSNAGGSADVTDLMRGAGEYVPEKVVLESGGAGLVSTMRDYYAFAQCMLNGGVSQGGVRILSRRTVEWMARNHLAGDVDMASIALPGCMEISQPGLGFGLGFAVTLNPVQTGENVGAGTFGWLGLAATWFYCDPVEQLVVIFMTQVVGPDQVVLPTRLVLSNVVAGAIVDGSLGRRP